MSDDEFPFDDDLTALALAAERAYQPSTSSATPSAAAAASGGPKITQPTPRALPTRTGPSSILVSPRQKGNPTLTHISALPWEYSDIPADFVIGTTTCALFLSLKYHRLHPEYIYTRIRALGQKYNLRILLTLVDIESHEEALRELAKTGVVNNLTLILCWSTREAARYLELYKSYEHAAPTGIRGERKEGWAEKVVEMVTVVRGVNRADAVGLVSAFGSVRAAVNAEMNEVAEIGGWGEKKVERWVKGVREPFRARKAGKSSASGGVVAIPVGRGSRREEPSVGEGSLDGAAVPVGAARKRPAEDILAWEPGEDEEEALLLAAAEAERETAGTGDTRTAPVLEKRPKLVEPQLSEGVAAALAKLRQQ